MPIDTVTVVKDQFDIVREYAQDSYEQSKEYLSEMTSVAVLPPVVVDDINYNWPEPAIDPDVLTLRPDPLPDLALEDITVPAIPDLDDIEIGDIPQLPSLSAIAPEITLPSAPDTTLPTAPGDAPPISDVDLPARPVYTLPAVPTIDRPSIPASPDLTLPAFEGVMPAADLTPPVNTFSWAETYAESDLAQAARTRLYGDIQNGGTGISEPVETATKERALARARLNNAKLYENTMQRFAAMGWSIPAGPEQAALWEIEVEQARNLTDVDNQILVESFNLAQKNTQFAITTAIQFEQVMLQHVDAIAGRAFEASKAAAQVGIDVFNANVLYYNTQLDAYKTQASVFETRIRAAGFELEAYKARLEGIRLSNDVQAQALQLYNAQLQGVQSMIDLYKAEMQAAVLATETDKVRLDAHRTVVEIYQAKLNAKTAQYNMYQAQLAGEESKVKIFAEQVRAYTAQVEAVTSYIQGLKTQVEARAIPNDQKLRVYASEIERYRADITKAVAVVDTILKGQGTKVQVYESDIRAATAELDAEIKVYDGRVQQAKNQTDVLLKSAELELESHIKTREMTIEAIRAGASISAQLAASALSASNVSAGMSWQDSVSQGHSYDETKAIPTTSHQHTYNETGD